MRALIPLLLIMTVSPLSAQQAAVDTNAAARDSMMNAILQQIQGRGQMPAESVFKDIVILRGRPAASVPRIMNGGFGRSLGVSCAHCHDVQKFDSNEKPQKQIARDMWAMMGTINTQLLPTIKNLKGPQPIVNCTTCHRGMVKPALNLP